MPADTFTLTKDRDALARVINQHVAREEARLSFKWTMWNLAWYYLNGARRFDQLDPNTGLVRPHSLDEEGNLEFQSGELMSAIDRVSGVLSSMDVRPKVMRRGVSLSSIRDRAVAQIIGDSMTSEDMVDSALTKFGHILTTLGSCGIAGHVQDHPVVGLTADVEVVHPRELFPFPSLARDYTKQRGLVRQRIVPLEFLKERFGERVGRKDNLKKMKAWRVPAGAIMTRSDDIGFGDGVDISNAGGGSDAGFVDQKKTETVAVLVRELWLKGHRDLVTRYVIISGDYVIDDLDFQDLEAYCPIGFARFIENGSFHGSGMFDLLFSISRELERLMKSLFNNIRNTDRYGVVVLPQGQFNTKNLLEDTGEGLKVLLWDADPVDAGFRPFPISPANTGDVPGKTAAFAKQMMDQLNPWQDLVQNKGRVDSAAGLGFLDEKNRELMNNATRAVERAWGEMHRSVLASASRVIAQTSRAIPVTHLTVELAGAVIDPESSTVSFSQNPLPSISNLAITIRDTNPRSEVARKQEALELMGNPELVDPQRFILFSLQEGLDFAMYMEEEKAAYETVVRNILLLYGDGESTGEIITTPHTAMPELQLRVLGAFMASPVMAVASAEVQDAFKQYREMLMEAMGLVLPAAVPNPDDEAQILTEQEMLMKELEKAQSGGGGSGGPLPFPAAAQQGA